MKKAKIFWFTGLSGSGKSTVALAAKRLLEDKGLKVFIIDGDQFREQRGHKLGFTESDIKKNNQLIAQYCLQEKANWDVIFVPIISPYIASRQDAKKVLGDSFYEIYVQANLECVIQRDTKGLYQKAINHEINNLIGFSKDSPYQAPTSPDLTIHSGSQSPEDSTRCLVQFVLECLSKSKGL